MPNAMTVTNPWRVHDSDSEDEIGNQHNFVNSLPPRPFTPNLSTRSEPRTPDWDPIGNEDKPKAKFGARRTTPSLERTPSSSRPFFSGPREFRSPSLVPHTITRQCSQHTMSSLLNTTSSFDPASAIEEDETKFIYTFIPKDYTSFIHCSLRREKSGLQNGFFPTYYLHYERPSGGKRTFLLAARRVPKIRGVSEYLISTNVETLSEKSGGDGYVGKLQESHGKGTAYTLYDDGVSPKKLKKSKTICQDNVRNELASIIYNTTLFSFKGPRDFNVVIPEIGHDIQPLKGEDTILDLWRDRRLNYLIQLRSRSLANDGKKDHVTQIISNQEVQSSVKNFQLIMENKDHEEEVVMQLGRTSDETFLLDYRYPLSAIQVFAIALSSFDSGLSRQ